MTNPNKQVEKLIESARDTINTASTDISLANALVSEFYLGHSEKWQINEKGRACQSIIDALCEIEQAIDNALRMEPYLTEL